MDADVLVIGGGPVGAALGMLLRRSRLRAMVLERSQFPRDKPCGEGLLPSGAAVLEELGVDLGTEGFPVTRGVRYRLADGRAAAAKFRRPGFGVRRLRLDALLAERAGVCTGIEAKEVRQLPGGVLVETSAGPLRARAVVGADGVRSAVRAWMGWSRAPRPPHRYALVGHLEAWRHRLDEIVVTILGEVEVYVAPTGPDELLAAVLGGRGALRRDGLTVADRYREIVLRAHPELAGSPLLGQVRGAGPFRVSSRTVAEGRVFLAGDAAGFLDPLTGEAMAAGLAQARALAGFLSRDLDSAAARYRRWHRAQWWHRRAVGGLALRLTGSQRLAVRALGGMARRPAALERFLEVNDGSRGLGGLRPLDWAALVGL